MYTIITTPGFIIDSKPHGEAGKLLHVFTRDMGLVMAVARGIRLEKSKLRYFAQPYCVGIFSFVRGKEFWRLTSAQSNINISNHGVTNITPAAPANSSNRGQVYKVAEHGDLLDFVPGEKEFAGAELFVETAKYKESLVARIALLLKRLLHGEQAHPELFDLVAAAISFLEMNDAMNEERIKTLESFTVLNMLHALGYVGKDLGLDGCFISKAITAELLDGLKGKREAMNKHINKALRESHL